MSDLFKSIKMPEGSNEVYFWSDTHFNHASAAKHCGFDDVVEYNEWLIEQWNSTIAPNDTVIHLGDFSFGNTAECIGTIFRLNGKIHLVPGNHDARLKPEAAAKMQIWPRLCDVRGELDGEEYRLALCHFPMLSWNRMHYGAIHLHGHCHGNLRYPFPEGAGKMFDVGVDGELSRENGFRPVSLRHILEAAGKREFVSVDHHKPKEEGSWE